MDKKNLGIKTRGLWKNPEYRKHMSEVHKGQRAWNKGIKTGLVPRTAFKKGQPSLNGMKGKKHSLESRKKMSKRNSGENHWNWKGGRTIKRGMHSLKVKEWRKEVFENFDFTCVSCGEEGGILRAHHINEWAKYPRERFDVSNGLCLHDRCHIDLHQGMIIYG